MKPVFTYQKKPKKGFKGCIERCKTWLTAQQEMLREKYEAIRFSQKRIATPTKKDTLISHGAPELFHHDPKKPSFKVRMKKIGLWILRIGAVCTVISIIAVIAVFIYFSKDLPEVGKVNTRFVAESTKIYDRTGEVLLYDIHGEEKRTIIPHEQIPETIRHATIALEDQGFYEHNGVNLKAIIRAAASQVFGIGVRSGGSTITQQLIKNTLLTNERSVTRKIKEAILAIELEFKLSKDDILDLYLNEIPYGSNSYGIEAAAKTFFDKAAIDLTYDEAALLASLPQAPTRYNPYGTRRELVKGRQETALNHMADLGYITREEAEQYKTVDVFAKLAANKDSINAPHFVFYVIDYLEDRYGEEYIQQNGLTVRTSLDWEKQQIAERIVKEQALINEERYDAENAALVSIDADTGEILTMVGSRDYFDEDIDGKVNVTVSERQPGSSFKPYVFLLSFIKGYTPETIMYDVPTAFPVDRAPDYEPQNYDGTFRGPVKIKDSLALSLNIPAVKALYLVGLGDVIDFVHDLGISTLNKNLNHYGLSLVLGGGEVKLVDHVSAFSTFANDGVYISKTAIISITDRDGQTIQEYKPERGERIVEKEYTDMLSHVLSTNEYRTPAFGANNALRFDDRPVAAKTGTTNGNRDAWTVGYTPEIAVGVWAGNNDNSSMNSGGVGSNAAAPIFRDYIREAHPISEDAEIKTFSAYNPEEFKTNKDILDGEIEEGDEIDVCLISKSKQTYCLANEYCPDDRKKERTFIEAHTILRYVNPRDPRGPEPSSAERDPSYKVWDDAVEDYYKDLDDGKVIFGEEPNSCDASDFDDYKPELSIDLSLNDDKLKISADEDSPFDKDSYTYIIDGEQAHSSGADSYTYTIPSDQESGRIEVEVIFRDEIGNTASDSDSISYTANSEDE